MVCLRPTRRKVGKYQYTLARTGEVKRAVKLLGAHFALDVPLKQGFGFGGYFEPFHVYAGKRVGNFSCPLCPVRGSN